MSVFALLLKTLLRSLRKTLLKTLPRSTESQPHFACALCWLLTAISATASAHAHADFSLALERSRVEVGSTFGATFTYDGDAQGQSPDFTPLTADFEIRATSMVSRHQLINGIASGSTAWLLSLAPRRAGVAQIPALTFRNARSVPAQIQAVALASAVQAQLRQAVFFSNDIQPQRPYVQAQITLTRRLYYTGDAQLYGDLPALPDIADVIVQPLSSPSPNTEVRNGVTYGVVEQRFALFPQASGDLTIPSVAIQSSVRDPDGRRRQTTVESGVLRITVLAKPADYPARAAWLPAHALSISEIIGDTGHSARVGDAITRTLVVRAEGLSATTIPSVITAHLPRAKTYADAAQFAENSDGRFITGTRTQTITWVPTAPGALTLPALQLPWWDVDQHMVRTALLPARIVAISSAPGETGSAAQLPISHKSTAASTRTSSNSLARDAIAPHEYNSTIGALVLSGALLSGAALTLLIVVAFNRMRQAGRDSPLRRIFSTRFRPVESDANNAMSRTTRQDVERACVANDATLARKNLAAWLATRWQTSPAVALAAVADEPAIRALSAALFAGHASAQWQGAALRGWLNTVPAALPTAVSAIHESALPPLYPP